MNVHPLRFEPAFKSMLWGGTQLRPLLGHAPSPEKTGEAWVLSDVDGTESIVAKGPWKGQTLRQVLAAHEREILGSAKRINGRFPLLLKFIDAALPLSVQVHPNDEQAAARRPGLSGKTEAWYVVGRQPDSKIYSGFVDGMTEARFREALAAKSAAETLHTFTPAIGDCLFLEAGTVHAIGAGLLIFEVQQTSDITYRLYDWDRVDSKTGLPRELHIDDGLACSRFASGPCRPVVPKAIDGWEQLVDSTFFTLRQLNTSSPRTVQTGNCRAIVCIEGHGTINGEAVKRGETLLIPACLDGYEVVPHGTLRLLECGVV